MWVALSVLVVLLLLLAMPVEVDFAGRWPSERPPRIAVGWAFGLVKIELPTSSANGSESPAGKGARGDRGVAARIVKMLRDARFRGQAKRTSARLWRAVRKDDVRMTLRVGLGEPADTGLLWSVLGPLSPLLAAVKDCRIRLLPDFDQDVFEAEGAGRIAFAPARILGVVLAFACSRAVWRSWAAAGR